MWRWCRSAPRGGCGWPTRSSGRCSARRGGSARAGGRRAADAQLVSMFREAGASVEAVATRIGLTNALRRGYPVNDVVEAIAARRALGAAMRLYRPTALVFSTTTAALLAGRPRVPFAVWLDSPAR